MKPPRVTLWRLDSLPGSETFIRNQIAAMTRWRPTLLGSLRVPSAISDADDPVVFSRSWKDRAALFLAAATGRSRRVRAAIEASRPEIVHAHFAKDAWMVLRTCRKLRIPLVVTVHGYDVTALPRAKGILGLINRRRIRAVLTSADAVVAVSWFIRDEAIRWGAPPEKISVLPIGIPLAAAPGAQVSCAASRTIDIIVIARLVPKKGVIDALQAIAEAAGATAPSCEVIGDGPLRSELERRARDLGLNVSFRGELAPEQVAERLQCARIFLAPSQRSPDGDAEGFGMVFLEAARARVPAVAYHHGGVPEAVVDGRTGLLAPEGDRHALAAALGRLLRDEDLRAALGQAAQQRVRSEFDIRACTQRLEKLYDEVLSHRSF